MLMELTLIKIKIVASLLVRMPVKYKQLAV